MLISTTHIDRHTAERTAGKEHDLCISISDSSGIGAKLSSGFFAVLRLKFDDCYEEIDTGSRLLKPITSEQATEILEFVDKHHQMQKHFKLIVHCNAGVSRSAAVARWTSLYLDLPLPHRDDYPFCNHKVITELKRASGMVPSFS